MIRNSDTKFTKLFVGGIPYDTSDETLREYFTQFGDIVEAVVIRDRDNNSRGYGFVTMLKQEDAAKACKNKRPKIDGRVANVNLAYLGAKQKTFTKGSYKGSPTIKFNYGQNFTLSGQPMAYTQVYTQTPLTTGAAVPVIQSAPTSGQPLAAAQVQPLVITDFNGVPTLVFGQVYDPSVCYSPQYLTSPTTPVNGFAGPTFTFPGQAVEFQTPSTPPALNGTFGSPVNGQQFFQAGVETLAQPVLQPLTQQ